jgi:hypothetical protein
LFRLELFDHRIEQRDGDIGMLRSGGDQYAAREQGVGNAKSLGDELA